MERVGSDRVLAAAGRLVVLSRADMPGWEVREYRRVAIVFRGERFHVAARERRPGGFRYVLEPAPGAEHEIEGGVIEYDEDFVWARDAALRARAGARLVASFLVPLYPLIGLLPGWLKRRLADRYGISEEHATVLSLWLEGLIAMLAFAMVAIRNIAGWYGPFFGVDAVPWLNRVGGPGYALLALLVPDVVMRYSRILGESDYPYGFWEWLFRRERRRG